MVELVNVLDSLVFEDEPSIFTEEYALDFTETALILLNEFMIDNPQTISEPDFHEILLEEITYLFYIQMENCADFLNNDDDNEDDMDDLLADILSIFITTFYPDITFPEIKEIKEEDIFIIEEKIQKLRELPQPVQRTSEWYQFRWNLITASNAWKAFESQATINQLIYEKCIPLNNEEINEKEVKMINTNSPLHWGQKYEPLSVQIYEYLYKTNVEDFGCIQHPKYKFIGASPDGIIINKESERFGRMLEIKNVVSREITGIPKKEYWVQTQLQMEVCDLDECDFLETKFSEYPDRQSYESDKNNENNDNNKQTGIIIYFHMKAGKPFYVYKPLTLIDPSDIDIWEEDMLTKYQSEPYNYMYMKFIYWKLDVISCVLILRNRDWFKNNIGQLEKVWKIIEEERVTGYEHRAPNKKTKKEPLKPFITNTENNGCLLKFNKIIKINTEII